MAGTIASLVVAVSADTTQLDSGVAKSTATLTDFEKSIGKVNSSAGMASDKLQAMTKPLDSLAAGMTAAGKSSASSLQMIANMSVSGREELQRLNTAASQQPPLLERIKSSLGPLGPAFEAAFAAGAAYFTVEAIKGLITETVEYGARLFDLSKESGLSSDALQAFGAAGREVGLDLESIALAASQLSKRISGNDDSARSAVAELGLSFTALKSASPTEQLLTTLDALTRVDNASVQAALASELFGKSGIKLLGIVRENTGGLDELVQKAKEAGLVLGEDSVDRLHAQADAWTRLGEKLRVTTAAFMDWATNDSAHEAQLKKDYAALGLTADGHVKLAHDTEVGTEKVKEHLSAQDLLTNKLKQLKSEAMAPLTDAQKTQVAELGKWGVGEKEIADLLGTTTSAVHLQIAAAKEHTDAEKKAAEATKQQAKELETLREKFLGLDKIKEFTKDLTALGGSMDEMSAQGIKEIGNLATEAIDAATRMSIEVPDQWRRIQSSAQQTTAMIDDMTAAFKHSHDAARGLVNIAGSNDLSNITDMVPAPFAPDRGVSGGSLTSPSSGITKRLQDMWQGMSGGNGISGLFTNIGGDILTGGINSLMSKGISLVTKGIGSLFGKLFGGEGKKTNQERDTWIAQNFGTQDQLRQLAEQAGIADSQLRMLFDTKKTKDFEAAAAQVQQQLKGFADDQAADQQRLTDAIQKYGFSIEELGPKLQAQNLNDQAKELIEDWRVLAGAGIDVSTVNSKMADTVNDYLKTAMNVGVEVPLAMKPILQSMVDQGALVDANGVKITDLSASGITFAETMTQGFDRVVTKLQQLIDKLNATGGAISNIPKSIDVGVNYTANQLPGPMAMHYDDQGYTTDQGLPQEGYAGGTAGSFLNFGAGRAVMLHGRERVMTETEGRTQDGGIMAGLADLKRAIVREIPRAIKVAISDGAALAPRGAR